MPKLKCDVLIVGAGASGSTISLLLSKMGYDIITIDKVSKIGGFTNPRIDITESQLPFGKIDGILRKLCVKPFKRVKISNWNSLNESFTFKSNVYDYYFKRGPSKDSLDCQIMKKAKDEGCNFIKGSKLIKFTFKNKKIREVTIKKEGRKLKLSPSIVVGADGSFSQCRKLAKIKEVESHLFEGFGALIKGKILDKTTILFNSLFAPGGYIYCGSVKNQSILTIIIDKEITDKNSQELFFKNKRDNPMFKKLLQDKKILNYFGGKVKYGILNNVTKGNLILVGEAGLFIDPLFGYGLNYAIFSAFKGARIINEALENDEDLSLFEKFYIQQVIPYLKSAIKNRKVFRKLNNKDFDFIIKSLSLIANETNLKDFLKALRTIFPSFNALKILFLFSQIFR